MTDTASKTDEQVITELHEGFVAANRTGDWSFLEAHMAPGADALRWYNLNQSNYIGQDHIIELWKMLKSVMQNKEAKCITRDDRVEVIGDAAVVSYLLDFEADFGALGAFKQEARSTEVWQRIDGDWKMIHFHCSNYVPGVMGGK